MSAAQDNSSLRHLRHTPAGAEYVSQMAAQEADHRTRTAFRELVLRIARPGTRLLDFGAGPGMDARFFAERGFLIDAYDIDPRMREYFADHCRDLIANGSVALDEGSYREFLARRTADSRNRADLVIANFAPLNLVDDLHELIATFDALTSPEGKVLASVLNPCFSTDMRSRWWWRNAPRLWRDGELFLPGPQAPHYRRLLRHFHKVCRPYFRLTRAFRGDLPPSGSHSHGIDLQRNGPLGWLHFASCRYLFLLFEKTPQP